jgi:hypothetical protein
VASNGIVISRQKGAKRREAKMNTQQLLAVIKKYEILMAGAAEYKDWYAYAQYEKLYLKAMTAYNALHLKQLRSSK